MWRPSAKSTRQSRETERLTNDEDRRNLCPSRAGKTTERMMPVEKVPDFFGSFDR